LSGSTDGDSKRFFAVFEAKEIMKHWIAKTVAILLPVVVLAAGAVAVVMLFATAPQVQRTSEERLPPVVEAIPVMRGAIPRTVEASGTVLPARQVEIVPEVSGRVIEVHKSLEPGGIVPAGEVLLRIDPEEYELALDRAQGALSEAEANLDVEKGQQMVAEREWELFGKDLPNAELGKSLALREPQLRQAEAQIASVASAVKRAELDLRRTEIRAPFDALVLREFVDVGQYVSPGSAIAMLAGADTFWVQVSVKMDRLGALLESAENETNAVRIFSNEANTDDASAVRGTLVRHLGEVTPGRMAQLLIEVQDPLNRSGEEDNRLPLVLNSYVRAELDAGTLSNGVTIPREGLRENGEIWVMDAQDRVAVREGPELWREGELVVIADVFEAGDRIIISPVEDLVPGMEVRLPVTISPEAARELEPTLS
jgi:RND family efflux transporter MFP subunit